MNNRIKKETKGSDFKFNKVMATTAIAGLLLGGTVLEPATLFAASKQQTTTVSKTTLNNDVKKASVTQNKITLTVTKAIYDGNYVQLEIKRSGGGLKTGLTEAKFDSKKGEFIYSNGAINNIKLLIDGKSIPTLDQTELKKKGDKFDTAQIYFGNPSGIGDEEHALPNKFKLTAKITLEGTKQPFTLELPMQISDKAKILQPKITKKYDGVDITLNKVNITTKSTSIQIIEKGNEQDKPSSLYYDIVDDRGVKLDSVVTQMSSAVNNNEAGERYRSFTVKALNKDVKSITVKPYVFEFKNPGEDTIKYKEDKNGEPLSNFIKELEMKVKVK
jgi:hypothetical protein